MKTQCIERSEDGDWTRRKLVSAAVSGTVLLILALLLSSFASVGYAQHPDANPRTDYLTFAAGAVPLSLGGEAENLRVEMEAAVNAIDGDGTPRTLNRRPATDAFTVEFAYALPASTTFSEFAVPNVLEVPSPSQTFIKTVEVLAGPSPTALSPLARVELSAHTQRGQRTVFRPTTSRAVRYLTIRLSGGLEDGAVFRQFSELEGYGRQESVPNVTHFQGSFGAAGRMVSLAQTGVVVRGCVDSGRKTLEGTVSGNLLFATLRDRSTGVPGAMVLVVRSGALWGVRSDNGAPFRLFTAEASQTAAPACQDPASSTLGCGDVVHGIQFEYDSATLLPASFDIIDAIRDGLRSNASQQITIEGHTSTEGSDEHNLELSRRRAEAVVERLRAGGIDGARLRAVGAGETRPLTRESTETERAMNRRVEIHCAP